MKHMVKLLVWLMVVHTGSDARSRSSQGQKQNKSEDVEIIVVKGDKITNPTKQSTDSVYTGCEITREGLSLQGAKAAVSVYQAVDILPGIVSEGADPHGLAAEQKSIRTRGVRGHQGALTVEGIPNYGGNPMGPREYIYDTENLEGIAVYKGAVPADLGTGVGARGGAIELRPRWPKDVFELEFAQSIAANNYARTSIRFDSGGLAGTGASLAGSYSYTEADKWKGPGDLGPRNNLGFFFSQPLTEEESVVLWYNYNNLDQHLYKSLNYEEISRLSANYYKDYNQDLSGEKTQDIDYYGYNRGHYENHDVFARIPIRLADSVRLEIKPYFSKENTQILGGSKSRGGVIQKRMRNIERFGLVSHLSWVASWARLSAGYWLEISDLAIQTRLYDPVGFGFQGYGMYMQTNDSGLVHSPFVKLAGEVSRLDWQVGVKLFYFTDPRSQGYLSPPPDFKLVKADDLVREERTVRVLLPSVGVGYRFSDIWAAYASYSRNHIRPYAYMPLINLYNQYRDRFQQIGVDLADLFDGYQMEISDSYELGVRFSKEWLSLNGAVFVSTHNHLLTTVYDSRVDLSYYQNKGKATGRGLEVELNLFVDDWLTFFINPTYTELTYDQDLNYQGVERSVRNKQVVDTPRLSIKGGLIVSYMGFRLVPRMRYLGERYGDAQHVEVVSDYMVFDASFGYTYRHGSVFQNIAVNLECTNIFNAKYVSVISAMDDSRAGETSYYVGAPRSFLLKASLVY